MSAVPVPPYLSERPRVRGHVVPWFVSWIDGQPDFRVIDTPKIGVAVRERRCWLCGNPMGSYRAFLIGPMCAVNRVSSEPPSHRACAEYAAQVCPFLANPSAPRRETQLPRDVSEPAGVGLKRNPGVALVWITRSFNILRVSNGVLFQVGDPTELRWFAEGRPATRAECLASIESGLPLLREPAEAQGPRAVAAFERMLAVALALVPTEAPGDISAVRS